MKKSGHHPDYIFISCVLILVVFGLVMLSSASSDLGKIKFNDTYYYLKHQLFYGLSLGIAGFFAGLFINYRVWRKLALPMLIASSGLLLLVFTPLGIFHGGAARWIDLGMISFQPSEFVKFTFIIYLAAWLSSKHGKSFGRQNNFISGYLPFLIISGAVAILMVVQHSTGPVIIIMLSGLLVYFISGARLSFVFGTILLGIFGLILLVYSTPYRFARVETYLKTLLEPETVNYLGQGFQINQTLMSIGSGGIFGVGFGQSTNKFKYLPEPLSDSIFAVIAQELGFVGAVFLIGIFAILFIKGMDIANKSSDQFAKLTVIGFSSIIAIQTLINIAAISGVIPLTGVPLPFISYGGTSLAIFLTMAGVIGNISKYT